MTPATAAASLLRAASVPIGIHFAQASADDVLDEDRDEYLDRRVAELVCGFIHPTGDQRGPLGLGVAGQPGKPRGEFGQRTRFGGASIVVLTSGVLLDGVMSGSGHGLCRTRTVGFGRHDAQGDASTCV